MSQKPELSKEEKHECYLKQLESKPKLILKAEMPAQRKAKSIYDREFDLECSTKMAQYDNHNIKTHNHRSHNTGTYKYSHYMSTRLGQYIQELSGEGSDKESGAKVLESDNDKKEDSVVDVKPKLSSQRKRSISQDIDDVAPKKRKEMQLYPMD